jgi:hypothetical protein
MVVAPGVTVQPHSHVCDYTEILLEGSEQVTRKWHHAGDVRVVKAGTVYGPLVAGPEGVTKLIIFKDDRVRAVYAGQERPADDDDLRLPMPAPWSETRTSSD